MIAGIIVAGSIVFGVALCAAWLLSPGLRVWMEQPKHRFQESVRRYDRSHPARHD